MQTTRGFIRFDPTRVHSVCAATAVALSLFASMAAQAQPVRYKLDPKHSFVNIEVQHFNTSTVRARFDKVDGQVDMDDQDGTGKAEINIDTASISSGLEDFDQHLKSEDFLNVQKYPKAAFKADDFVFADGKVATINGTLTMLDQSHAVALQAVNFNCYDSPMLKAQVCGGDFEAAIKRSQWGMNWGIDMGIPDQVRLLIQVEAVRQK